MADTSEIPAFRTAAALTSPLAPAQSSRARAHAHAGSTSRVEQPTAAAAPSSSFSSASSNLPVGSGFLSSSSSSSVLPIGSGMLLPGAASMTLMWKAEWAARKSAVKAALSGARRARAIEWGAVGAALPLPPPSSPATRAVSLSLQYVGEEDHGHTSDRGSDSTPPIPTTIAQPTYTPGVLLLLTGIPTSTPFSALRAAVSVAGRPAYVDCPIVYGNGVSTPTADVKTAGRKTGKRGGQPRRGAAAAPSLAAAAAAAASSSSTLSFSFATAGDHGAADSCDTVMGGSGGAGVDIDLGSASNSASPPSTTDCVVRYHTPEDARRALAWLGTTSADPVSPSSPTSVTNGSHRPTSSSHAAATVASTIPVSTLDAAATAATAYPNCTPASISFKLMGRRVSVQKMAGEAEIAYWRRVRGAQSSVAAAAIATGEAASAAT